MSWLLAFGNNQSVALTFLGWMTPAMPLFVWLVLALFLGILIGLVFGRLAGRKAARK
ncbi:lipopolysaccharide assembly protein LapA domain-containing protein [Saccharospirillum alexandrii]|uniref:LapA family protein n=1 Tax=Saccharospirillum alexandrii TaxID=2448477 RepID=UPI0037354B7E